MNGIECNGICLAVRPKLWSECKQLLPTLIFKVRKVGSDFVNLLESFSSSMKNKQFNPLHIKI